MRVNCAITHPAAMFRREAYDHAGGYPMSYPAAEDYGLFAQMLATSEAANIPQVLVRCRTGDGGISENRRRTQLVSRCRILLRHFDGHPMAVYGILRAVVQLATPRRWSTRAHQIRVGLAGRRSSGREDNTTAQADPS
jgi:glycosyltransferase, family 2